MYKDTKLSNYLDVSRTCTSTNALVLVYFVYIDATSKWFVDYKHANINDKNQILITILEKIAIG